jgi:poly-gamma-glutamate synthesis protein (capsule biosynthesis protein)
LWSAAGVLPAGTRDVTLFLCGDVMTGRGIDQILPHPSKPHIAEQVMTSALGYVELAEQVNGLIKRPASFSYIWGDALAEFARLRPHLRIINLETSITTSEDRAPKGINYRMHPKNAACLKAAGIDCASLANNHVLDWGPAGLIETLKTLREIGVRTAGAGADATEAESPALFECEGRRVIVLAYGMASAGVPASWAGGERKPGVAFLPDLSAQSVRRIAGRVKAAKREGDIVVLSMHWGGNWGYDVPREHVAFAHGVIDGAGVDIVHGHSSHHPLGIEVYRGKLILYGCGDFLNDYEGIGGYEEYRSGLVLMYFATVGRAGSLERLEMTALETKRFRLQRARPADAEWLRARLDREGRKFGTSVARSGENRLALAWK